MQSSSAYQCGDVITHRQVLLKFSTDIIEYLDPVNFKYSLQNKNLISLHDFDNIHKGETRKDRMEILFCIIYQNIDSFFCFLELLKECHPKMYEEIHDYKSCPEANNIQNVHILLRTSGVPEQLPCFTCNEEIKLRAKNIRKELKNMMKSDPNSFAVLVEGDLESTLAVIQAVHDAEIVRIFDCRIFWFDAGDVTSDREVALFSRIIDRIDARFKHFEFSSLDDATDAFKRIIKGSLQRPLIVLDNLRSPKLVRPLFDAGCYLLLTSADEKVLRVLSSWERGVCVIPRARQDSFLLEHLSETLLPRTARELVGEVGEDSLQAVLGRCRASGLCSDLLCLATFPRGAWIPETFLQALWDVTGDQLRARMQRLRGLQQGRAQGPLDSDCLAFRLLPQLHEACSAVLGREIEAAWLQKVTGLLPRHRTFFLEHGPALLRKAEDAEGLADALTDLQFLQEKLEAFGLPALIRELKATPDARSNHLDLLDRVRCPRGCPVRIPLAQLLAASGGGGGPDLLCLAAEAQLQDWRLECRPLEDSSSAPLRLLQSGRRVALLHLKNGRAEVRSLVSRARKWVEDLPPVTDGCKVWLGNDHLFFLENGALFRVLLPKETNGRFEGTRCRAEPIHLPEVTPFHFSMISGKNDFFVADAKGEDIRLLGFRRGNKVRTLAKSTKDNERLEEKVSRNNSHETIGSCGSEQEKSEETFSRNNSLADDATGRPRSNNQEGSEETFSRNHSLADDATGRPRSSNQEGSEETFSRNHSLVDDATGRPPSSNREGSEETFSRNNSLADHEEPEETEPTICDGETERKISKEVVNHEYRCLESPEFFDARNVNENFHTVLNMLLKEKLAVEHCPERDTSVFSTGTQEHTKRIIEGKNCPIDQHVDEDRTNFAECSKISENVPISPDFSKEKTFSNFPEPLSFTTKPTAIGREHNFDPKMKDVIKTLNTASKDDLKNLEAVMAFLGSQKMEVLMQWMKKINSEKQNNEMMGKNSENMPSAPENEMKPVDEMNPDLKGDCAHGIELYVERSALDSTFAPVKAAATNNSSPGNIETDCVSVPPQRSHSTEENCSGLEAVEEHIACWDRDSLSLHTKVGSSIRRVGGPFSPVQCCEFFSLEKVQHLYVARGSSLECYVFESGDWRQFATLDVGKWIEAVKIRSEWGRGVSLGSGRLALWSVAAQKKPELRRYFDVDASAAQLALDHSIFFATRDGLLGTVTVLETPLLPLKNKGFLVNCSSGSIAKEMDISDIPPEALVVVDVDRSGCRYFGANLGQADEALFWDGSRLAVAAASPDWPTGEHVTVLEGGPSGLFLGLGSGQLWRVSGGQLLPGPHTELDLRFLQWLPDRGLLVLGVTRTGGSCLALWKCDGTELEADITNIPIDNSMSFARPKSGPSNTDDILPCVSPNGRYVAFFQGELSEAPKLQLLEMTSKFPTHAVHETCPILCAQFHPEKDSLLYVLERAPSAGRHSTNPLKDSAVDRKQVWRLEIQRASGPYVARRMEGKNKDVEVDSNAQALTFMRLDGAWKLVIVCSHAVFFWDMNEEGAFRGCPQLMVPSPKGDFVFTSAFSAPSKLLCVQKNKAGEKSVSLFEVNRPLREIEP